MLDDMDLAEKDKGTGAASEWERLQRVSDVWGFNGSRSDWAKAEKQRTARLLCQTKTRWMESTGFLSAFLPLPITPTPSREEGKFICMIVMFTSSHWYNLLFGAFCSVSSLVGSVARPSSAQQAAQSSLPT